MKKNPESICLVSGGMDSLVTAAIAYSENPHLAFLHVNYGQKTETKELECFHAIADHYHVAKEFRKVIDLAFLKDIGGSSLTDQKISVKKFKGDSQEIPDSYVPFRNSIIISMAVAWAEILKAKKIYIGAVDEDSSGYPDCRPSYYLAMNNLIKEGTTQGNCQIITPVITMSKKDIVLKALELKAPLEKTWSCYKREDQACGECDSCALRLRGFLQAGLTDPLIYSKF
jgi:7-cyano-7-deazaguanine synthase